MNRRTYRPSRRPSRLDAQKRLDAIMAAVVGVPGFIIVAICAAIMGTPGAINPDYSQVAGDILGLGLIIGGACVGFAVLVFNSDYR